MFKKLSGTIIVIALIMTISTPVLATPSSTTPAYSGYGQDTITRALTPEESAAANKKEAEVKGYKSSNVGAMSSKGFSPMTVTSNQLTLITNRVQEQPNYCGPASSLQLLDYRWVTPDQDDLAADWDLTAGTHGMNTITNNGTTTPDMVRSINWFAGITWYISSTINSSSTFWSDITFDIDNNYPANMLIDTKYLSYYQGKSLNHFVTLYGYWDDGTTKKVDIDDPNYMTAYTGFHTGELFTNAFNAINAQNWRANFAW